MWISLMVKLFVRIANIFKGQGNYPCLSKSDIKRNTNLTDSLQVGPKS